MNKQVRDGLSGLCLAAVAVIVGFALGRGDQTAALARLFYLVAGVAAVLSFITIGRGLTAGDESD